jgi:anti-sigma B factor antagonist
MIRIAVGGDIDLATVGVLTLALNDALDQHPSAIVVDLKKVTFMDSTGINALMSAFRRANTESTVLTVVNCPALVAQVLQVLGIYDRLTGGAAPR